MIGTVSSASSNDYKSLARKLIFPDQAKRTYLTSLANKNPASNAMGVPKKNGALGPNPVHALVPCQSKSAIHEADPIHFQI